MPDEFTGLKTENVAITIKPKTFSEGEVQADSVSLQASHHSANAISQKATDECMLACFHLRFITLYGEQILVSKKKKNNVNLLQMHGLWTYF